MPYDPWYIYGAGGLGAETVDILRSVFKLNEDKSFDCRFIDDGTTETKKYGIGTRLQRLHFWKSYNCYWRAFCSARFCAELEKSSLKLTSILDPSAVISQTSTIHRGVIIAPLCSVQARAEIKENTAVNTMSIIGHDVTVGNNSVISSMVNLGAVTVGENSYIGMGALVKEGISIGSNSIIGMGSVVYNDIPDGMIALGNPARVARKNEDQKVLSKLKGHSNVEYGKI